MIDLAVRIGGVTLKNPVTVASGTFGYGREYAPLFDISCLGAIVTKTITPRPRPGNPPPRLAETSAGMLNAIGLQNEGLAYFLEHTWPELRAIGTTVIVSISGASAAEYRDVARRLEDAGVAIIELNLSCPNISYEQQGQRCLLFAQMPSAVAEIVGAVKAATGLTVITKLSPMVTDIAAIAVTAEQAGTDAVSLVNTFLGMAIDISTGKPKLSNVTGGLSGPAIKPLALRLVYSVCQAVQIPVVGMGGIFSGDDAVEFILAGATAISVGTANFVDPTAGQQVLARIISYCQEKKITSLCALRGKVRV